MSCKGKEIGKTFDEIKQIIDLVENKKNVGVCLDTCHIWDAGYDLKNKDIIGLFDKIIGLSYLQVIHLNDSKNPCGSKKDRHENFGYGCIGFDTLLKLCYDERLVNIPKILESPIPEGFTDEEVYGNEIKTIVNKEKPTWKK